MARANGKMTQKYVKLKKWPKITFRGPILVPEVAFWRFWGLVCIEKIFGHFTKIAYIFVSFSHEHRQFFFLNADLPRKMGSNQKMLKANLL